MSIHKPDVSMGFFIEMTAHSSSSLNLVTPLEWDVYWPIYQPFSHLFYVAHLAVETRSPANRIKTSHRFELFIKMDVISIIHFRKPRFQFIPSTELCRSPNDSWWNNHYPSYRKCQRDLRVWNKWDSTLDIETTIHLSYYWLLLRYVTASIILKLARKWPYSGIACVIKFPVVLKCVTVLTLITVG